MYNNYKRVNKLIGYRIRKAEYKVTRHILKYARKGYYWWEYCNKLQVTSNADFSFLKIVLSELAGLRRKNIIVHVSGYVNLRRLKYIENLINRYFPGFKFEVAPSIYSRLSYRKRYVISLKNRLFPVTRSMLAREVMDFVNYYLWYGYPLSELCRDLYSRYNIKITVKRLIKIYYNRYKWCRGKGPPINAFVVVSS